MFAEQHQLGKSIKDGIIWVLKLYLDRIPHIQEVVNDSDVFKDLPITLVKEIYLNSKNYPWGARTFFAVFVFWLSGNDCTEEDKREILDSIDFNEFTVKDLLNNVRKSGLYPEDRIERRVIEKFREKDEEINSLNLRIHTLEKKMKK